MAQLMVAHWLGRWLQKDRQDLVNIVREDSAAIGYSWRLHMHQSRTAFSRLPSGLSCGGKCSRRTMMMRNRSTGHNTSSIRKICAKRDISRWSLQVLWLEPDSRASGMCTFHSCTVVRSQFATLATHSSTVVGPAAAAPSYLHWSLTRPWDYPFILCFTHSSVHRYSCDIRLCFD